MISKISRPLCVCTTSLTVNDEPFMVGVLDTEQNKQIYEAGREVQTLRFD